MKNILEINKLCMHFPVRGGAFHRRIGTLKAVDGVSLSIAPGETLGLVGESGCGKSTLGRCIVRLLEPTAGTVHILGYNVTHRSEWRMRRLRRKVQMVFQDPAGSLNPRMTVRHLIAEPLNIHGMGTSSARKRRVAELLDMVALAMDPKLLVLDEPVSALDVSVQSQVLNLLLTLQQELNLAYLFISHDLSVVRHISDRVAVMYMGKIVELADADRLYDHPCHAYTRALLSAIPNPDPTDRRHTPILPGDAPSPVDPPPGSAFGRRINHPYLEATVGMDLTPRELEPGHWVAPDPCAVSLTDLQRLGVDIYQ